MRNYFQLSSYCCFSAILPTKSGEVLEHLPWEQFEKALMEIARVSKKHVIISIPYDCFHFEIIFRIPFLTKYFKNKFFHYKLLFPKFYKNHKFIDQHYWEMGKKNFSKRKIANILKKYFIINKTLTPILNSRSYFFILEKKTRHSSDTPNILPS